MADKWYGSQFTEWSNETVNHLLGYLTEDQWIDSFVIALESLNEGSEYGPDIDELVDLATVQNNRWSLDMDIPRIVMTASKRYAKYNPDTEVTKQMLSDKYQIKETLEKIE
tara:strand:+ start:219 stop:551 length:333 start_codon:yes stop_codon:yes gene_type:complete